MKAWALVGVLTLVSCFGAYTAAQLVDNAALRVARGREASVRDRLKAFEAEHGRFLDDASLRQQREALWDEGKRASGAVDHAIYRNYWKPAVLAAALGSPFLWALLVTYRCDWCLRRLVKPSRFPVAGGRLCSLRCKAAYEASTNIKEERVRVIEAKGRWGD